MFALQRARSYYQCLTDGINRQTDSTHRFITPAHTFTISLTKNASMHKDKSCEARLGKGGERNSNDLESYSGNPRLNLGQDGATLTKVFRTFPQILQANAAMVRLLRHGRLLPESYPIIHLSSCFATLNDIYSRPEEYSLAWVSVN